MKKFLVFFSAITISIAGYAQTPAFEKSDLVFNAAVGFGSGYYGAGYSSAIPSISLSGEYGIVDDIWTDRLNLGVGAIVQYAGSRRTFLGYVYTNNYLLIGVRGAFHYTFVDNLDVYAGVMTGYNVATAKVTGTVYADNFRPSNSIMLRPYVGARYYFSDNFGVMGELGGGITYLNVGVTLKF